MLPRSLCPPRFSPYFLLLLVPLAYLSFHSAPSFASARFGTPKLTFSTFVQDPHGLLSYRDHLELTTSLPSQITHSPTMGFGRIFVLSLPTRLDRRDQILKMGRALGVVVDFIDAANKDEPMFAWIAERVAETRNLRREIMAKAQNRRLSAIGGLKLGSEWLLPYVSPYTKEPFPPHPNNWVQTLETAHTAGNLSLLVPSSPDLNLTALLWDPKEKMAIRQVSVGVMSTFWGHTRALKRVVEEEIPSALIMEDDIDIEWDIERIWSRIRPKLPEDGWDIVYLGHCWGHELSKPAYLHPLLHQSSAPMCLHGWAVSLSGARRLLSLINNPWSAYSTAVDLTIPSFISWNLVTSFTVMPPLIIQRKDSPSDLQIGTGSKWRGVLRDSTWERILRDEGETVIDEEWNPDPDSWDPARTIRGGGVAKCIEQGLY